jgi:hypothetical protein
MYAAYKADQHTGKVMYGYVTDKCPDNNYWCKSDAFHLDLRKNILDSVGMTSGWNGRKISWDFVAGNPSGCVPSTLLFFSLLSYRFCNLFSPPHVWPLPTKS